MFQQIIKMSTYPKKGCLHTQKKDVDIPKKINVNITQNKDVNIPSVHINIPPSPTNKPSSLYYYQNIVRRKLTLKINTGNDKNSFNVTLHKMRWKSIVGIKQYILERNSKYTYDCQTIKYMGNA